MDLHLTTKRTDVYFWDGEDRYLSIGPPGNLLNFRKWVDHLIDKIPTEHRALADIHIGPWGDWPLLVRVGYSAPIKPNETMQAKLKAIKKARECRLRKKEAKERKEYERLAKKFGQS